MGSGLIPAKGHNHKAGSLIRLGVVHHPGACAWLLRCIAHVLLAAWLKPHAAWLKAHAAGLLLLSPPRSVNRFNSFEGWVGSESVGQDILISGRIDMNRAMEGDVVAGKCGCSFSSRGVICNWCLPGLD